MFFKALSTRALFAAVAFAGAMATAAGGAWADFSVRILHTNDLHSRVDQVSKYNNNCSADAAAEGKCFGGYARIAAKVRELRSTGDNVLLLDGGDQFQGSLFYTTYKGYLAASMMNLIGYEAMAVGNHEFDDGPETLAAFIARVGFPVISANIDASKDANLFGMIQSHAVLDVGGEKVGIIGFTAEDTPELASTGDLVVFNKIEDAVRPVIADLEAQGVTKIIALSHSGMVRDREVASGIDGIDVIIGGHDNTFLSNTSDKADGPYPTVVRAPNGDPVLIVQAFAYSRYLGDLSVTFDDAGVATAWAGEPIVLDSEVPQDPQILAAIDTLRGPVEAMKGKQVGMFSADMDGDRKNCRAKECTMGNLITDALLWKTKSQGTEIAIQNGGGIRASIPGGDVTMGDVLTVLPFQNSIATFKLKGSDVVAALENGVGQVEEGAGRFPQVGGMRYTWDPSKEPGSRIVSAEVLQNDGSFVPLDPEKVYSVVSNDFMRGGGDGYAVFRDKGMDAYDSGPGLEEAVAEYVGLHSPVEPKLEGRITAK